MSFDAMRWVMEKSFDTPTEKFVLLTLAHCVSASDEWSCYPSVPYLVKMTGYNIKTVYKALMILQSKGLILITKRTRHCNYYTIVKSDMSTKNGSTESGSTKSGIGPEVVVPYTQKWYPGTPKSGCSAVPKQVPKQIKEQIKEQGREQGNKEKSSRLQKPNGVEEQVWLDFLKLRKAKKSDLTQTALNLIAKEAEKAGISLNDALQTCCMRGWAGFKADWIKRNQSSGYERRMFMNQPKEPENLPTEYYCKSGLLSEL